MKSLSILPNATVVLGFASGDDRDAVLEKLRASLPREVHSTFRSGTAGGVETLTIRLHHVSHPFTISLESDAATAPAPLEAAANPPTYERLKALDRDDVPGEHAAMHTEDGPFTSGENLTQGVPGAVNNDPSTAMNAAYEGSPGQALKSVTDGAPATPAGFMGPDKAAKVAGAAPGTANVATGALSDDRKDELLQAKREEKPDAGAVAVSTAAANEEKAAAEAAKEAKPEDKKEPAKEDKKEPAKAETPALV